MGVERVVRALPDGFGSLAFLTPINVLPDVPVDPWPPVVASDQFMCLYCPGCPVKVESWCSRMISSLRGASLGT